MESIKVINGSGKVSREKINILLDSAIEFYGSKYESVILDVVKHTYIYEMSPHENVKKVILDISGRHLNLSYNMPKACHLTLKVLGDTPLSVVIWKPRYHDQDYSILAHELYGHAVCSRKKLIVNGKFTRNGISLYNMQTGNTRLELLNEGFMEFIAKSIVENTNRNITNNHSKKYDLARKCAEYIVGILGKNLILDDLVEYQGMIEKEYTKDCGKDSLVLLEYLLQCEVRNKVIFPMKGQKVFKQIRKELEEFKKRKSRIR